ncbi:MAG: FN3 associated domain-containing protein, partial [Ruminococcus sp.]
SQKYENLKKLCRYFQKKAQNKSGKGRLKKSVDQEIREYPINLLVYEGVGKIAGLIEGMATLVFDPNEIIDSKYQELYSRIEELMKYIKDNSKCEKPDDGNGTDWQDIKPILDPSGYVYEAVPSNRVEGVKAEIYRYDYPLDEYGVPLEEKEEILWDAENYDQINPQITDANGGFAWDVPDGKWIVKLTKDGYYDTDSRNYYDVDEDGYMDVPPIRTDVNTAIVSKSAPKVEYVNVYSDEIQVKFSQYMKLDTVNSQNIVFKSGNNTISGTLKPTNAEYNYEETEQYATDFVFVPDTKLSGNVQVTMGNVKNYNGKVMETKYSESLPVQFKPEKIEVEDTLSMEFNSSLELTPRILPAEAGPGRTLTVTSNSPEIVAPESNTVVTDSNGYAKITLKGKMPGQGIVKISLDGTNLSATVTVNVETKITEELERVQASVKSGTAVKAGTKITLTSSNPDAKIYYTLDSSCPCQLNNDARTLYTGPITITKNTDIIAYAVLDGYKDSKTNHFSYTIKKTLPNISKATVKGITTKRYTGKALTQKITVTLNGKRLVINKNFTVKYYKNKNVGTAKLIITGKGNYTGSITKSFKIIKANQSMTAKAVKKTVKASKLKKSKQTVAKAIVVKKAVGSISYVRVAKGSSKKLTINKKTGKITVKKGTKKGTYKIKVKITARGNSNYNSISKIVTVYVKVK